MSSPNLKQTLVALAIVEAFTLPAYAQTGSQALPEIIVSGSKWVAAGRAGVAGFSDAPLMQTPASVIAIGREQMQELNIRSTTDAVRFDASVSDSYNAVGYAEMFSIRGFMLDNNNSYRKDGIAISGDTQIPLENKERFEILKGLAGLTAGVAAPGGVINYAIKRPTSTALRSVTLEARERGTLYGALDLGGRSDDKRFGYRINAADEKLRPYVKGAHGYRHFIAGAFDWQISAQALLQLDLDYQHKSQITAPGFQLTRGTDLPLNVSVKTLLNDQPWTKPVDTRTSNIGMRFEYQFNDSWHATLAANKHEFRRDDYTAFPYGCSNEGAGFYPGYCSNGDYDVYDYQSVGERKNPFGAQALVQGKFATGALKHELTLGASYSDRSDYFGDYVYDLVGSSNIYHNVIVPPAPPSRTTGPVLEQRHDQERAFFAQDILTLSPQFKIHAGLRHVSIKRTATPHTSFILPSLALVYNPARDWMVYSSFSHGMEYGGIAPFQTANEGSALAPNRSRQVEAGVKAAVSDSMTVSAALFQVRRAKEYTTPVSKFYVQAGEQQHRGIELDAQGSAGANLKYSVSLMALAMQQEGTGLATFDGKRPPNVAAFKSTSMVEYALPQLGGLKVSGIWQYAGKKAFDEANTVFVPAYHVFGIGSSYATRLAGARTTLRANIDNVTNKFYWRDATPLLGGYLFAGAPRTLKVSAQFDF